MARQEQAGCLRYRGQDGRARAMADARFHSEYTDAAGNRHAQFEYAGARGEVCLDKGGKIDLAETSRNLSKPEIVELKRAYRAHCGPAQEG
ncbi:MAG: hypothetical protein IT462_13950 [Planctomycetes bacterium]|nr:hypothetical protein [Planctomycetota bacterium]